MSCKARKEQGTGKQKRKRLLYHRLSSEVAQELEAALEDKTAGLSLIEDIELWKIYAVRPLMLTQSKVMPAFMSSAYQSVYSADQKVCESSCIFL